MHMLARARTGPEVLCALFCMCICDSSAPLLPVFPGMGCRDSSASRGMGKMPLALRLSGGGDAPRKAPYTGIKSDDHVVRRHSRTRILSLSRVFSLFLYAHTHSHIMNSIFWNNTHRRMT